MDVALAQAVFGTVLDKALAGIHQEDPLATTCIALVDHDDAGGDARAIEQVGWQADDPLDQPALNQVLPYFGLGIAAE